MALYDETDIVTTIRARELADGMMRELEATLTRPIAVPVQPAITIEPEELLPPPPSLPPSNIFETSWSTTMPIAGAPALLRRSDTTWRTKKPKPKAKSRLHWAVFAMTIAIGLGLWQDPGARANAKRQLQAETHRVIQKVASTRAVVSARKVVSARII